jgi:uncharacterized protein YacL
VKDLLLARGAVILTLGTLAFFWKPFSSTGPPALLAGLLVGTAAVALEWRLRALTARRLLGGAVGAALALLTGFLLSWGLGQIEPQTPTLSFIQTSILALALYLGAVLGASKGDSIGFGTGGVNAAPELARRESLKILDTSVIIDGRIADIAETGFLDGILAIPQFVLRELQLVADSADSMKRNRGRRGLDILQRIQKMPQLRVQILEDDFSHIRDVDMKLIEVGKLYGSKIVTNDFNLNKVAQLHGVEVLNINELANALKPVVLPGETMRVFVLKEGKEYNQGVAYLDDGTMVVVDNARRLISKTIDISVTSVLQTTAGKMIFGRFDERTHAIYEKPQANDRQHDRSAREQSSAAAQHP